VLQAASQVSALWQCICSSEELWFSQLEADFSLIEVQSSPKVSYRAVCLHHSMAVLPSTNYIEVCNCRIHSTVKTVLTPELVDETHLIAALVFPGLLFVMGTAVLGISLETAERWYYPGMKVAGRWFHAAIAVGNSVYVFGGCLYGEELTQSAERYTFKRQTWEALPDMLTARCNFNACYKGKRIYLCGGFTTACEYYDIETAVYSPMPCLSASDSAFSFHYQTQLLCVTSGSVHWIQGTILAQSSCKASVE